MTITLTREGIYTGVLLLLMVLQIYQWIVIKRLSKDYEKIWDQISILVVSISNQLGVFQKEINNKEDKKNRL